MKVFIFVFLLFTIGCTKYKEGVPFTLEIAEVGTCTNATDGNMWSNNPKDSYCRVKLDNGIHINLKAPVIKGEKIKMVKIFSVNNKSNEKVFHRYKVLKRE